MEPSGHYSALDRAVHRLAFSTARFQLEIGDLETLMFRGDLAPVRVSRPVFITALPRAGTTTLLEICAALDDFACHTYRDMPFPLLPMLWDRLTRGFRRDVGPSERAHGDGKVVSPDATEAFEEVIWMAGWPDHYQPDRIVPWTKNAGKEFRGEFVDHLRKIIAVRRPDSAATARYASKNNANIARIPTLLSCCPDAIVIVPVRDPIQQASSLLQQHRRFIDIHAHDPFGRAYMRGIGHFEFGADLKPIDFGGWLGTARFRDPNELAFWIEYWVAAYAYVLGRYAKHVHFVAYDRLCANPVTGLEKLVALVQPTEPNALLAMASTIRPPRLHEGSLREMDRDLLAGAEGLYNELLKQSEA